LDRKRIAAVNKFRMAQMRKNTASGTDRKGSKTMGHASAPAQNSIQKAPKELRITLCTQSPKEIRNGMIQIAMPLHSRCGCFARIKLHPARLVSAMTIDK
jgi:hypothetical protein